MLKRTGIMSAYRNHRQALDAAGLFYTEDPTDEHDVLHLHWIGPRSYYHLQQAKRSGKPVVITAHSTAGTCKGSVTLSELINPFAQAYLRHIYNKADLLIAPTPYTKSLLQGHGIKTLTKVISNGVDVSRFSPNLHARECFRQKFGLSDLIVLSVGQVIPRKGVLDFLDVAKSLPEFEFLWIGERLSPWLSFYPLMHYRIEHAPRNVHFLGFIEHIEEIYAAADIFFFPSYEETQGLVLLEAAAMGLPIVLRDIPIYQQGFIHGINCLKGHTIAEFIDAIKLLASSKELRRCLGSEALKLAYSHRLDQISNQYKVLYETLLERKKAEISEAVDGM